MRDALVRRRAGRPRRLKRLDGGAAEMLAAAAAVLAGDGAPAPPALVRAIEDSRAPQTWNRYLGPLRAWSTFAEARGVAWLPADPRVFAEFLSERGAGDVGYSQTKSRVCAIDALSTAAGVASPSAHPLVAAVRAAARRTKRARRGPVRPIFAAEIPLLPSPERARGPARAGRGLTARSQRARCATAAHMAALHDGALRYDDLQEGQLGDALFFPGVVEVSVFGSKTDRELVGQTVAFPSEGPGAAGLLRNARTGLQRLVDLDPASLRPLSDRLRATLGPEARAGPEAVRSWPDPVPELAQRLYALGVPVHGLPLFGRWLFEDLSEGFDLSATPLTGEFARMSKAVLAASGAETGRVGAHSFRRGRAVGLYHGGAGDAVVSLALRHRNPRSAEPYVLVAARSSALASAMRVAGGGGRGRGGLDLLAPPGSGGHPALPGGAGPRPGRGPRQGHGGDPHAAPGGGLRDGLGRGARAPQLLPAAGVAHLAAPDGRGALQHPFGLGRLDRTGPAGGAAALVPGGAGRGHPLPPPRDAHLGGRDRPPPHGGAQDRRRPSPRDARPAGGAGPARPVGGAAAVLPH